MLFNVVVSGVHFQILYYFFWFREGRSQKGASLRRHENNDLQQKKSLRLNIDNRKKKNSLWPEPTNDQMGETN